MAHITVAEAQAWLEPTKLTLTSIDAELEDAVATLVFTRLSNQFETGGWTSPETTPKLVRKIIAMCYASRVYDRQYSEDEEINEYAQRLHDMCMATTDSIIDGTVEIPETEPTTNRYPSFFPNDASSAQPASEDAPSDGGPYFRMGTLF